MEQIFAGDVADWSAVGGSSGKISIYTRNTSSGTYSNFKEDPTRDEETRLRRHLPEVGRQQAESPRKSPRIRNGIGYVGLAYTKAGGIKVMPIDGQLPSVQSVHAKTYPYARPTFYYTSSGPGGLAKQFVKTLSVPSGRKIASQVGFVPIK